MPISYFILFTAVPAIMLVAFLITVFFGYKKEGEEYSLKAYLTYEAFERMNPATRVIARILYFIYLASLLPFYAYVIKYSGGYNDQLVLFSAFNLLAGVVAVGLSVALTYVKATLPQPHLFLAIGHGLVVVVNAFTMSSVLNLIRTANMVSSRYDIFILIVIVLLILIATFVILLFVKRDVYSWEYIEKEGKRSFFALAFTEWLVVFFNLAVYLISVISLFIINC